VILKLASYRYKGGAAARGGVVEETAIADWTDLIGARGVEALLTLEPKTLRSLVAQAKQRRPLCEIELLPPILNPPKIVCVG
jgi:hypothetical protein